MVAVFISAFNKLSSAAGRESMYASGIGSLSSSAGSLLSVWWDYHRAQRVSSHGKESHCGHVPKSPHTLPLLLTNEAVSWFHVQHMKGMCHVRSVERSLKLSRTVQNRAMCWKLVIIFFKALWITLHRIY